jgi:hypothetical protein
LQLGNRIFARSRHEADDRRAEEPCAGEAEEEPPADEALFGTARRQVTGNFGGNNGYAKVMNKFTTDPTNIGRYATGNGKKVELQNAGKRVFHARRVGGDQQL